MVGGDYFSPMHSHYKMFHFVQVWLELRTLLLIFAPIFQVECFCWDIFYLLASIILKYT